ncbi:Inositol-pentakisphosphate 2-kinase IPK1-like protein [Drosera capensis]
MELVTLEEKDAGDWSYRGEGAANLVLSYTGSSPAFVGKVLRVPKVPKRGAGFANGHSVFSRHERLLWEGVDSITTSPTKEIADQLFVQHVMIPLLGSDCVDTGPKCGFLPSSRFISEENAVKKNVTRFKMHQILKLHQRQLSQLSEYDPLDLFSGSRDRVHKAIKALFTTPQNNLRVLLNGSLVYGGLGGGMNGTSFVNGGDFEDHIRGFIKAADGSRTRIFQHLVAEIVYKLDVLDILLGVQKLDSVDIEGAIHAYYNIVSQPCAVCKRFDEDKQRLKYSALHSIPLEESVKIVRNYLIAATAKDCSLMISLRPRQDGDPESAYSSVYLESTNQSFEYKAYFIDLDLRPLKKMEYYYELDQEIVNCYTQMVNPHSPCKQTQGPSVIQPCSLNPTA